MPYCASTEIVKEGEDYLRMKAWFGMKIRIQNFRAFVEAKGHYFSEIVHFRSTRWQILLDLCKHDSVEKKVISSSRAKFLHAFVYAESAFIKEMICCSILTEIISSSEEDGPMIGKRAAQQNSL